MPSVNTLQTKALFAYQEIKRWLISGKLKPGERLVGTKLCEELRLSRGPVREALLMLQGEGFVRKEGAGKGHLVEFIEDIPPDQLLHRYELREQIGAGACRLAAKYMNGWQIDRLKLLAKKVDEASNNREQCYLANHEFHRFLLENCGNPLMQEIWESHRLMPSRPRSSTLEQELMARAGDPGDASLITITEAIAAHDQTRAEEAMKQRVRKITEALRITMRQHHPHRPS